MENQNESITSGSEILESLGFTFPCLSIDINNSILKDIGVNSFPTVLIFDKESNLIFKGSMDNAATFAKKLLKNAKN